MESEAEKGGRHETTANSRHGRLGARCDFRDLGLDRRHTARLRLRHGSVRAGSRHQRQAVRRRRARRRAVRGALAQGRAGSSRGDTAATCGRGPSGCSAADRWTTPPKRRTSRRCAASSGSCAASVHAVTRRLVVRSPATTASWRVRWPRRWTRPTFVTSHTCGRGPKRSCMISPRIRCPRCRGDCRQKRPSAIRCTMRTTRALGPRHHDYV